MKTSVTEIFQFTLSLVNDHLKSIKNRTFYHNEKNGSMFYFQLNNMYSRPTFVVQKTKEGVSVCQF